MLFIEVDVRSPVAIYEQIIDSIQRLVREEKLLPGADLPSVRQLASDLGINPNTVARAYGLLEKDGIIETARRRGTRISDSAPSRSRVSLENRIEDAVDRVVRETAHLGIDPDDLVQALIKRLATSTHKNSHAKRRRS
jgi:GntR family transcriptional regulator